MTFERDEMDYRDFLRLRAAGRGGGGRWFKALLEADLQPMVPVRLAEGLTGSAPTSAKNALRKAAKQLGLERFEVIALGGDVWVCILAASDAPGEDAD